MLRSVFRSFPLRLGKALGFLLIQSINFEALAEIDTPRNRAGADEREADWVDRLGAGRVTDESIIGFDARGIPILCGTGLKSPARSSGQTIGPQLPSWARSWETIPCVIRDDGVETFRLEVNVNGSARAVRMPVPQNLQSDSGKEFLNLRDDGGGEDRVARDNIFTSEKLFYDTNYSYPIPFYMNDTNSPPGLQYEDFGGVEMIEEDGSTNQFTKFHSTGGATISQGTGQFGRWENDYFGGGIAG